MAHDLAGEEDAAADRLVFSHTPVIAVAGREARFGGPLLIPGPKEEGSGTR